MKLIKEDALLEENEFVRMIDSRSPVYGKIRVSKNEWNKLWDIKLGDTNNTTRESISDTHKWFKKTKEFADKYECV